MGDPTVQGQRRRWRGRRGGCGCGCGGALVVLTLGLALSLFHADLGIGVSARIPFTPSNLTLAASVGSKDKAASALPGYVQERVAGTQNFINQTGTLTIGPAEGIALLVIGKQNGAPAIDLHLESR